MVSDEPGAQPAPALEQLRPAPLLLVLDRGAAWQRDELLGPDDSRDELGRVVLLHAVEQTEDLRRVVHPAAPEALQVLEQRSLATLELVVADALDGAHQVAQ